MRLVARFMGTEMSKVGDEEEGCAKLLGVLVTGRKLGKKKGEQCPCHVPSMLFI